ncbi:MAG TPA: glycoside hydrolase family 5 protein [Candidatus Sulfotelmatobacter sp.]|jgi:aryl-phospho-beta-D-glucosidase BglC (GH1 family)|nr:glycoside hydrolase family 5 protein [Candidatus Sulfotelmatobacter sp.]
MNRFQVRFVAMLIFLCSAAPQSLPAQNAAGSSIQPTSAIPGSRVAHLRRGINASEWFAQVYDKRGYTKEHFQDWTTAEDIALMKSMGFDHVRLSVNPQPMMPNHRPDEISEEYFVYLDAAVKMILDQGMAVVIDLHPESDFKTRLTKDDSFVQEFADFWRALAKHYSTWDPERVFFEILNEPEFSDRYRWYGVQTKLATAIREGAPQHTIIGAGARWSNDDELVFLEPLRDPNVIYNFHFYDPHIFTHQGATWGSYFWHWVKGLHYPSSPESAAKVAANVPDAMDRMAVIRYGQDHWDASRIDAEITQVADWARQRGVPVVCNEFGVYRAYAEPRDREAWIHDVRTALEQHGMGWTMWDYSGSFGVVTKKDGRSVPDEGTLRALGLKQTTGR